MCEDCIVAKYDSFCKCKLTGETCFFVRRCTTNREWVSLDSMSRCPIHTNKNKGNVRFEKKGFLYITTDEGVVKILNPYDYIPQNVNIVKDNNGEWKIIC